MIDALDGRTPHRFGEEFSQADLRSALVELKNGRVTIATLSEGLNAHDGCVTKATHDEELGIHEDAAREANEALETAQVACVAGCFDGCRAGH